MARPLRRLRGERIAEADPTAFRHAATAGFQPTEGFRRQTKQSEA